MCFTQMVESSRKCFLSYVITIKVYFTAFVYSTVSQLFLLTPSPRALRDRTSLTRQFITQYCPDSQFGESVGDIGHP